MKKREIILDFTSLLDVILILLFLILCSMNATAKKDAEEIESMKTQNVLLLAQKQELSEAAVELDSKNEQLTQQLEELQGLYLTQGDELAGLQAKNEELQQLADASIASAQVANELLEKLQELSGLNAIDKKQYELFLSNICRIELQCVAKLGEKKTSITVFVDDEKKETILVGQGELPLYETKDVFRTHLDATKAKIAVVSMVYNGSNNIYQNVYDGLPQIILELAEEYQQKDLTIWFEPLDLQAAGQNVQQ